MGVEPFGDDNAPKIAADTLVFDLKRINAAAYGARYNKATPSVAVVGRGVQLSLPALLKALQCVRCNCDGGESRGALETLDSVIEAVTESIIDGLPEYANAQWFV